MHPALPSLGEPPRRVPFGVAFRLTLGFETFGAYLSVGLLLLPFLFFLGGGIKQNLLSWGEAGSMEARVDFVQSKSSRKGDRHTYHISYVVDGKVYQSSCWARAKLYKERTRVQGQYSLANPSVGWLPDTSVGGLTPLIFIPLLLIMVIGSHRDGIWMLTVLRHGRTVVARRVPPSDLEPSAPCWRFTPEETGRPVDILVAAGVAQNYQDDEPVIYMPDEPGRNYFLRDLPAFVRPRLEGGWQAISPVSAMLGLAGPAIFAFLLLIWWRFLA